MKEQFERFDMKRPPMRTRWYLRPLTYLLSVPDTIRHGTIIHRQGTENLKPPYVMLCNHNAFMDFKVATKAIYPQRANYVVAIDGFIGREELLRQVGCICKRKFTNDITLIRQLKAVVDNGDVAMIYPEARYSLCGTTAVLPASLGKLCKLLKVPVVTCQFGQLRPADGAFVQRATEAKAARGDFVRWCAERGVTAVAELAEYRGRGYVLDEARSTADTLAFVRR